MTVYEGPEESWPLSREGLLVIKNEILKDPKNVGYLTKNPSEIAALMNTFTTVPAPTQGPIPPKKWLWFILKSGKWTAIQMSADDTVLHLIDFLQSSNDLIDAADATEILNTMIRVGIIDDAAKAAVLALGNIHVPGTSRASDILFGWTANPEDILAALTHV